jgi:hypothetical protein
MAQRLRAARERRRGRRREVVKAAMTEQAEQLAVEAPALSSERF